eukprot:TRINITY_DN4770_c0_g1_i19.p2 TRINITY_DN4770_c0_g1~~TRINITY_DN4770_c0_g1_i19.p2  ORF type:complete len:286 (+),score=-11.11 TRINITY_DN4770_c0_g1_i19:1171-2028(+)
MTNSATNKTVRNFIKQFQLKLQINDSFTFKSFRRDNFSFKKTLTRSQIQQRYKIQFFDLLQLYLPSNIALIYNNNYNYSNNRIKIIWQRKVVIKTMDKYKICKNKSTPSTNPENKFTQQESGVGPYQDHSYLELVYRYNFKKYKNCINLQQLQNVLYKFMQNLDTSKTFPEQPNNNQTIYMYSKMFITIFTKTFFLYYKVHKVSVLFEKLNKQPYLQLCFQPTENAITSHRQSRFIKICQKLPSKHFSEIVLVTTHIVSPNLNQLLLLLVTPQATSGVNYITDVL